MSHDDQPGPGQRPDEQSGEQPGELPGRGPAYRITLDALERSAQVPLAEQVEGQAEPRAADELSGTDLPGGLRPYAAG